MKVIVPDDYISRYELVKHLIGVYEGWRKPIKAYTLEDEIIAFPAADVKPVVRGTKVFYENTEMQWFKCSKCSVCGYDALFPEYNFCSHCGADLREDNIDG